MKFIALETRDLGGDEYVAHVILEEIAAIEEPSKDSPHITVILKNGKEYPLIDKISMSDIIEILGSSWSSLRGEAF